MNLNCRGMHQGSLERHIHFWYLYCSHVLAAAVMIRLLECASVIGLSRQSKHPEDAWHNYIAVLSMSKSSLL